MEQAISDMASGVVPSPALVAAAYAHSPGLEP